MGSKRVLSLSLLCISTVVNVVAFTSSSHSLCVRNSPGKRLNINRFSTNKIKPMTPSTLRAENKATSNDESKSMSSPLDRPTLAAVDILALCGFAAVGKASHAAGSPPDLLGIASTAMPFITAWLATSPFTGAYAIDQETSNRSLQQEAVVAARAWIIAVPLGIVLRGIIKGVAPPLPFVIVTMISTLVILVGGRVLFSVIEDFFVEVI